MRATSQLETMRGAPWSEARAQTGVAGTQAWRSWPEHAPNECQAWRTSASRTERYLRFGQPLLRLGLVVVFLPPALLLALPIALVNACLFRSLRQVVFRQQRVGQAGQVFWIYKFRTMHAGQGSEYDSWRSGEDDRRVTRFGRFLRNTHLDELPQFWNILRGEMDFIGPRPEMLDIHAWACRHVAGFEQRDVVRPGITGLAQVTMGYAEREVRQYKKKWMLDRFYIEQQSLAFDLQIVLRTALWMVRGRGWRRASR